MPALRENSVTTSTSQIPGVRADSGVDLVIEQLDGRSLPMGGMLSPTTICWGGPAPAVRGGM